MDKQNTNSFLQSIIALLGQLLNAVKTMINNMYQTLFKKQPEREINPPSQNDKNRKISRAILIALGVLVILSIFNRANELQQDELPYNQFLQLVNEDRILRAVVTEKVITGLIKPEDPSGSPRHFTTIPLWDDKLAEKLAKHNVEYVVRSGENWLSNILFNWIVPMLILVAIWSWLFRRMAGGGPAGRAFLNIGNKIDINLPI